jgi:hypothetical protein
MPNQLFTYYIENPLMIISINSESWGVMVIRLDIEIYDIVKGALKEEVRKGMVVRNWYVGCWVFWSLCMFGCISVVVVEGACVRDCRGQGLCTVGVAG